ncbi:MAG: type II toxin-antitoxin system RelE/ParE family toxin [Oscillospiraceae bacterium]|nr:type II toxin-antitoxin system RelE/ParE family toxin [Oscillospiraceae bacterium]
MKRIFAETPVFTKNWKTLNLEDNDLHELQNYIIKNPNAGNVIQGTGGLIKLRWILPNTGKSGGIRVLYVDFTRQEKIILINCYSKSEKDNITDKEKSLYKALIKSIEEELQ